MPLQSFVLIFHVAVALLIVGLVLLQRGKGASAGTGFGSGASGTVFGARGSASFLTRATAVLATLFFATSLSLAYLARQQTAPTSLLEEAAEEQSTTEPPRFEPVDLPELPVLLPAAEDPGSSAAGETAE